MGGQHGEGLVEVDQLGELGGRARQRRPGRRGRQAVVQRELLGHVADPGRRGQRRRGGAAARLDWCRRCRRPGCRAAAATASTRSWLSVSSRVDCPSSSRKASWLSVSISCSAAARRAGRRGGDAGRRTGRSRRRSGSGRRRSAARRSLAPGTSLTSESCPKMASQTSGRSALVSAATVAVAPPQDSVNGQPVLVHEGWSSAASRGSRRAAALRTAAATGRCWPAASPGRSPAGSTTATSDWLIMASPRSPECRRVQRPVAGVHHLADVGIAAAGAEAALHRQLHRRAEEQHVHRDGERGAALDDVARRVNLPAQADVQVDARSTRSRGPTPRRRCR